MYSASVSFGNDNLGIWFDLGAGSIDAFFHDSNDNKILFMPSDKSPWLTLGMINIEEAEAFIADIESRHSCAFQSCAS